MKTIRSIETHFQLRHFWIFPFSFSECYHSHALSQATCCLFDSKCFPHNDMIWRYVRYDVIILKTFISSKILKLFLNQRASGNMTNLDKMNTLCEARREEKSSSTSAAEYGWNFWKVSSIFHPNFNEILWEFSNHTGIGRKGRVSACKRTQYDEDPISRSGVMAIWSQQSRVFPYKYWFCAGWKTKTSEISRDWMARSWWHAQQKLQKSSI